MHYLDHDVVGKDFIDVSIAQSNGRAGVALFVSKTRRVAKHQPYYRSVLSIHHLKEGYLLHFTSDYTPS